MNSAPGVMIGTMTARGASRFRIPFDVSTIESSSVMPLPLMVKSRPMPWSSRSTLEV